MHIIKFSSSLQSIKCLLHFLQRTTTNDYEINKELEMASKNVPMVVLIGFYQLPEEDKKEVIKLLNNVIDHYECK